MRKKRIINKSELGHLLYALSQEWQYLCEVYGYNAVEFLFTNFDGYMAIRYIDKVSANDCAKAIEFNPLTGN